jgi:hypothetical protein
MPTKITVNCETGAAEEVEMAGAELVAYNAQRAYQILVYNDGLRISQRIRTTNATPAELWRATLAQRTGYRATLTLIAVDAGNGAVRTIEARVTAKRLTNGALLVGSPTVVSDHQDSGTSTWGITAAVSSNDFVVTVTGAAGRNIDWLLSGDVVSFTPGGR